MKYKLRDFADIERAQKGKHYPEDCTLVQISATRGQVLLHEGGEVESHYAVIQSKVLKPKFLYWYIWSTMPNNIEKLKTGLNIQIEALEMYPIEFPMGGKR